MKFKLSILILITIIVTIACSSENSDSLSESISVETDEPSGMLSVNYSTNLYARLDENSIQLASSETILDEEVTVGEVRTMPTEEFILLISIFDTQFLYDLNEQNEDYTFSAVDVVELFTSMFEMADSLDDSTDEVTFVSSEAIEINIGDSMGASSTIADNEQRSDVVIISKPSGDDFILLMGITASNEGENHRELFNEIIASATFTPEE